MALPGTNPTYQYLDSTNADGTILGQTASSLFAFHGLTPCDQAAAIANITTTATAEVTTAFNAVLAALREKGLIAT